MTAAPKPAVAHAEIRTALLIYLSQSRFFQESRATSPHNKNNHRNIAARLKRLSPTVGSMQQQKRSRGKSSSVNYSHIAYNKNGCPATQKPGYAVPCL